MVEIKLRAMRRIGELVRDLEKAKPTKGHHGAHIPAGGKVKGDAIRAAGLSKSTAARYEELAGPAFLEE